MLKSLRLKNFKLHEDTSIEAAPITVFIGPNNSGKSSIFQALLALRQAAHRGGNQFLQPAQRQHTIQGQPYLFPSTQLIDMGDFKDIVRHGQSAAQISVSGTYRPGSPLKHGVELDINFEVHILSNSLAYHTGSLRSRYGQITWKYVSDLPTQEVVKLQLDRCVVSFAGINNFQLLGLSGYQFPPDAKPGEQIDITRLAGFLASGPHLLVNSIHQIYPLRGFEEWGYPLPESAADSPERSVLPDRAVAIASILASNRMLKSQVSQRLSELLKVGIDVEYVGARGVKIWATQQGREGSEALFANEGTGAGQLPFILIAIALTGANETIMLSEPEAHLHPKKQSQLMAMLLGVAEKEHIQFIIETHSEHVLHKLLHSVAKGELAEEDLAIYYFEPEQGAAKVRRLEVDNHGGVKGGLPGFFDQSLAELGEYLDALKKP